MNWLPWSRGVEEHFGPWQVDHRDGRVITDEAGSVDRALRSRLDRWFLTVDLDDERIAGTVEEVLQQLVRMLDTLAPTRLDRYRKRDPEPQLRVDTATHRHPLGARQR